MFFAFHSGPLTSTASQETADAALLSLHCISAFEDSSARKQKQNTRHPLSFWAPLCHVSVFAGISEPSPASGHPPEPQTARAEASNQHLNMHSPPSFGSKFRTRLRRTTQILCRSDASMSNTFSTRDCQRPCANMPNTVSQEQILNIFARNIMDRISNLHTFDSLQTSVRENSG
jgi:hypothetical protein